MPDLAGRIESIYDGGKWADTAYLGIRNPAGAASRVATRYAVTLAASTPSEVAVEFGVDFRGGAMYLDGVLVDEDWNNPWWKGSFHVDTNSYVGCTSYVKDPCLPKWAPGPGVLVGTLSLTPGNHTLEIVGFEDGDDAGAAGRLDVGSGWQPMVSSVQAPQTLTISRPGSGAGRVVSSPAGIDCGSACSTPFPLASTVTLTATASAGSIFAGWTGRCSGTGLCTVTMYGTRNVGATFVPVPVVQAMSIETRFWNGESFALDGPAANAYFNTLPTTVAGYTNEPVPVTAFARNAALFTPPAVGAGGQIASRYVTTLQVPGTLVVQLRFSGDMSHGGAMLLDGAEIASNWGGSAGGALLNATATVPAGTRYVTVVGFEDCCDGGTPLLEYNYGTGWLTAQAPAPAPTPLTVAVPAAGGRVTSSPAGIDCGPSCEALFATGSQVVLTPTPNPYFAFGGWGGACTGTGACVVRMLQPSRSVTASFARVAWPVTLATTGTGGGVISSAPAGTPCGANCVSFAPGTPVTFTATADGTSNLISWSVPGCTGMTCSVTVNGELTVGARFDKKLVPLTVTRAGTGSGTVTSSPAGINCGAACTASFPMGTSVTVTAAAAPGSVFSGWTGACTGTLACTVPMSEAATVGAQFTYVGDTTPPTVSCKATPDVLWPVNHKLWDIKVNVVATDVGGTGVAGWTLQSVTSNEPLNTVGDGNTAADMLGWAIGTADQAGQFRAERNGTLRDRVYTLTYRAVDNAGNAATTSCTVTVPHDQR
jgi:hypothetical protein